MSFPACRHRRKSQHPAAPGVLAWLASEPFRVLFLTGAVWSIVGVALWPLWHAQRLTFYPGPVHSRLMIECFGGAFVAGFLGTAGPRMATAPKLSRLELLLLFGLVNAAGGCHLTLALRAGDACFAGMVTVLTGALLVRVARFRREAPPPQLLPALTGLLCGLAGAVMWLRPEWTATEPAWRLSGLLVHQGFLLLPVMGIGSFLFPRMLGGEFGEPATPAARLATAVRATVAAAFVVASFFLEAWGRNMEGHLLRAGTVGVWLLTEIRWRRREGEPPRGTLARGLVQAIMIGLTGLVVIAWAAPWRVGLAHLLYIGTFGLLMLIVGSRVLFGHSGELEGFSRRGWIPRLLVAGGLLAATTRASAEIWPRITVSHHLYAAWLWALTACLWLAWHRARFFRRDPE